MSDAADIEDAQARTTASLDAFVNATFERYSYDLPPGDTPVNTDLLFCLILARRREAQLRGVLLDRGAALDRLSRQWLPTMCRTCSRVFDERLTASCPSCGTKPA